LLFKFIIKPPLPVFVGVFTVGATDVARYQGCYRSIATGAFSRCLLDSSLSTDGCVTAQAVWNTLATAPDQGDGFIMPKADRRRQSFCSEYFCSLHLVGQSTLNGLSAPNVGEDSVGGAHPFFIGIIAVGEHDDGLAFGWNEHRVGTKAVGRAGFVVPGGG